MKKLTINPKMHAWEIESLEKVSNAKFPKELIDVLLNYAGCSVKENGFITSNGDEYSLSSFCTQRIIYDNIIEFKKLNLGTKVPFALNDGGWMFCLNLDDENNHPVLIHRYTDEWEDESDAFDWIANSLEEFIDSLHPRFM